MENGDGFGHVALSGERQQGSVANQDVPVGSTDVREVAGMRWRWVVVAGLALVVAITTVATISPSSLGLWLRSTPPTEAPAVAPNSLPTANLDFTLKDMNGNDVALTSFRGKVVVINFWATWCGPCKVEIPAFVELYGKYKDQGFVVLGVSVDDPVEKLKEFSEEYKMTYPVLVGLGRTDLEEAYGPLWGIPVSVFISRDGRIVKKHTGLVTKEQVEREVTALLAS